MLPIYSHFRNIKGIKARQFTENYFNKTEFKVHSNPELS